MSDHWIFKGVVIAFMIGIILALGWGLFFLLTKKNHPDQTAKALTVRIGLSLTLFALLFVAFAFGWIKPHGLL